MCSWKKLSFQAFLLSLFILSFAFVSCSSGSPSKKRGNGEQPPDPITDPDPKPPQKPATLCQDSDDVRCIQIASFNLEFFNTRDGNEKREGIANLIDSNDFDLLGLQEVSSDGVLDLLINLLPGGSSMWGYEIGDSGRGQRVAILYKKALFTLSTVGELFIQSGSNHWRSTLRRPLRARVMVTSSGELFDLVVLHLKATSSDSSCDDRKLQADDLNDWLNSQQSNVVMLGDYNDILGEGVGICDRSQIDTLGNIEANSDFLFLTDISADYFDEDDYTYISPPYQSVIDHILINRGFFNRVSLLENTYLADVVAHGNENISDHQPVYFRLFIAKLNGN